ncbi:MAG: putative porin [Proteobacteria bacterium]|nr:putative porin [Pseudomonadota bacterium]MBU4295495.1 putative porin [Pseudomonadota bacterium]MCG2749480.1 putative porin [Desulfobulbaceae bacterium]
MKKILSTVLALSVSVALPAIADAQSTSQDDIKRELEAMRAQLAAQMEKISALESKLEQVEKQKVEGAVVEEKAAGKVALANKFINQLTLKSDLRVRYDRGSRNYYNESSSNDYNRDRWRTRFRIGLVWDNEAEDWQVGAGLIANDQNQATNSNGTWSQNSAFDRNYVSLDYAYAKHKWQDFSFTLGQQPNPYEMAWVMYDGDVRFAGLTAQYGQKTGPFATLGAYDAKLVPTGNSAGDNTAMLYYGQAGYRGAAGDVKYTLAAGYQKYDQSLINDYSDSSLGNIDPDEYGLEIGDLYGKISVPAGSATLGAYGQIWKNFGADGDVGESQIKNFPKEPDDADMGWAVGVNAQIDKIYLGLDYSVIEADSLYGFLADADFGSGMSWTNKKGYRLQAGYDFTKNWSALISYLWYEQDEDFYNASTSKVEDAEIIFIDAKYKF